MHRTTTWIALLGLAAAPPARADDRIAITIDDVPWVGPLGPGDTAEAATERLLTALGDTPAAAFAVCEGRKGALAAIVKRWLRAGKTIGNHSASHRSVDETGEVEWTDDVRRCKRRLEEIAAGPVRWYRYPYLQRGKTKALRDRRLEILRRLGHDPAPVTVDTSEWLLAEPYVEALAAGDSARAAAIGRAWVDHVVAATRRFRALSDAPQVLLLHANAPAADHLGALLAALKADGARFARLDDVLEHPIYAETDHYVGPIGLSWLYRIRPDADAGRLWAWDKGQQAALQLRLGLKAEPDAPYRIAHDLLAQRIAPRVHRLIHETPFAANSLVVELDDGRLLLVDTPYTPEATRRMLGWVRTRFGDRRLIAVATHFHYDAIGGFEALHERGAETWASDETAQWLTDHGPAMRDHMLRVLEPPDARAFDGWLPAPPRRTFPAAGGLALQAGADRVRVVFPGPAHSPDNVVVHLPDHGVLFGGCMVKAGPSIGNLSHARPKRWPAALDVLRGLEAALVVPGHGDRLDRGLLDHTEAIVRRHLESHAAE